MKLDSLLVKNLCQDIEASNSTRSAFDLKNLVSSRSHTYGEEGSEKRRAVQKKFDQLRRKTPDSYQRFLDKLSVAAGEGLQRELRIDPEESSEDEDDEDFTEEPVSDSHQISISVLLPCLIRACCFCLTKPAPSVPAATTPSIQPPTEISVASLAARTAAMSLFSIPGSSAALTEEISADDSSRVVMQQIGILSSFKMDGSAAFPFLVMVNPNGATICGFDIRLVNGISHRNFSRDAYHIRKTTTVSQEDEWSATIPLEKYPLLANRTVLIRGPSQDFWHKDAEVYHQNEFCETTKTAHETYQTNLAPEDLYSHWLLVFPEGTHLENHVFSDNATLINKENNDLVHSLKIDVGTEDEEDVELFGMDVYWRIATTGGQMIRSPEVKGGKKKRFARRKGPAFYSAKEDDG